MVCSERIRPNRERPGDLGVRWACPTLASEMSTPDRTEEPSECLELPVEELLRRAPIHPPYGSQVIDDLTAEEADAFLDAVLN